jgi:tetratricopeptide (TPR) repeat protein
MGDKQGAEETYQEVLESPRQSAESEYFAGNILLQFDLPQYAERHFEDAVANLRDRSLALRARAQLGRALAAQGKIPEAEEMLQQVLAESPDDAEAARALAGIYLDQERPAGAAPLLRRALAANPDSADLLNDYATTLEAMGDTASAYEHYKRATLIDPSFAEAAENLALLCEGQGRLEEARDHFVAARDLFEKQGRYDEMHQCINRISELMTRLAPE